jgi:hypothetical protein
MSGEQMRRTNRVLGVLLLITSVVTVLYWIDYFHGGDVAVVNARWYTAYESSFPVADFWLAICALFAGLGYAFGWQTAPRFGLLAGSALLYLAAMDITFDIENHLYPLAAISAPMKFEAVINAWSLLLGIATVFVSWRRIGRP